MHLCVFLLMFQLDAWYPPIEATSCSNILTFLAPGELRYVLWCGFHGFSRAVCLAWMTWGYPRDFGNLQYFPF